MSEFFQANSNSEDGEVRFRAAGDGGAGIDRSFTPSHFPRRKLAKVRSDWT
jgi:hypothetical protein